MVVELYIPFAAAACAVQMYNSLEILGEFLLFPWKKVQDRMESFSFIFFQSTEIMDTSRIQFDRNQKMGHPFFTN